MTICRFWKQGHCKFGDSCRFEHSDYSGPQQQQNRYAPLNNDRSDNNNRRGPPPRQNHSTANRENLPYGLDASIITADLTTDRPIWPLSSYGPGRNAPIQLFGGWPREQSFEELRVHHYELGMQGLEQQAIQEAQQLVTNAEEQVSQALRDTQSAVKYIVDGENQHPNRLDICKQAGVSQGLPPSMGSQQPNPFNTTPAQSTFGQPSKPTSAFNQPATSSNPFARLFQQEPPRPFAAQQSVGLPQKNPFAATAGAVPAFGQPSAPASSPWGTSTQPQIHQTQNPFAAAGPQASSPFGIASNSKSPFSSGTVQDNLSDRKSNPFAHQANAPTAVAGNQPVALTTQGDPRQRNGVGKLAAWDGKQVRDIGGRQCFQRPDGEWERISFPEPPQWRKQEDLPQDQYDAGTEQEYEYVAKHGVFKDGKLPDLAPKRAWLTWNF